MEILEIIPINTKKSKVLLSEGLVFALYQSEIRRLGLKPGEELTEEDYFVRIYPLLKKRAFARALYILQRSFRTEGELQRKLKQGYYPEEIIRETLELIQNYGYIDDRRYAENYIAQKSKKYSRLQIQYKLLEKGVDRGLIQELLEETPAEEGPLIRKLLEKKHFSPDMNREEKQKVMASLFRRGFGYEAVRQAMETGWDTEEE